MDFELSNEIGRLRGLVATCAVRDRRRLLGKLRSAEEGRGPRAGFADLAREIEERARRMALRAERAPRPTFDLDLPVVGRRDEIAAAIRDNQIVVVCGETGSGKTTQLPKICLELGRGVTGLIGHTQPRRIAARSVAARLAEELRCRVGEEVGFKVRFGDQTGERTYIKLMTDGILLAETQGDRLFEQYDTIIIDEAHERSLNIDFILGYLRHVLPRRPDLKVVITSATIDPLRFSRHFQNAPVIEVSGRTYPVEVKYRPLEGLDHEEAIVGAAAELISTDRSGGDILVFLSGEREIRETAEALRESAAKWGEPVEILPLYARLSAQEQMRVFQAHSRRRIVLATNVAETSLTVPGIRYVIDPGEARISRYNARTKVQRLQVEPVSKASANQRAGRCGRIEAGVCVRLYSKEDFDSREEFTEPEILRSNLASVILQMKALKLGTVETFPFVEAPDSRMIRDGYETLRELSAVDAKGDLTALGAELSRLPIDPRVGRMLLEAKKENCLTEALIICAALSVQDARERPMDAQEAADQSHRQFRDETSDFLSLLNLWRFYHDQAHTLSHGKLRKLCRDNYLSYMRMREWHDVRQQLHALLSEDNVHVNTKAAPADAVHRSLLSGLLSNIGLKAPEGAEYLGTRGSKFMIFPGSGLFKSGAKWVFAGEIVLTTRMYARTVAKANPEWIERLGAHLLARSYSDPHWSGDDQQTYAYERATLFGVEIVAKRRVLLATVDRPKARSLFVHHALVEGELRGQPRFLKLNRDLIAHLKLVEAKTRQTGLIADQRRMHEFYDTRIPAEICGASAFEKWREQAERSDPRVLLMTKAEVLVGEESPEAAKMFPDRAEVRGLNIPLSYVHDSARADDGVTATLPVEALGQIGEEEGFRLVPGLLRERVEAMVKSLPRSVRKYFGDDAIEASVRRAGVDFGPLAEVVAKELKSRVPLDITPEMFRAEAIPAHAGVRYRVVDAGGRELGVGRNLGELKEKLAKAVGESVRKATGTAFVRDGLTDWDFGELPEEIEVSPRAGVRLRGFPMLVDLGEQGAGLRVMESAPASRMAAWAGLRRLLFVKAKGEVRVQVRLMSQLREMTLHFAPIGSAQELLDELGLLVVERAFMTEGEVVRSKEVFGRVFDVGFRRLGAAAREVEGIVAPLLRAHQGVQLRLSGLTAPAFAGATADVREQLAYLLPAKFLSRTARVWLPQFVRYLGAADLRLQRLQGKGLARDAKAMEELRPYWRRLTAAVRPGQAIEQAALIDYRWLVEEFRVSLFAQELRTAVPVSAKRLDEAWMNVRL